MTYALDTNIISYLLRGDKELRMKIVSTETPKDRIIIPLIVYYEIRRGLEAGGASVKAAAFDMFCRTIYTFPGKLRIMHSFPTNN